MPPAASFSSDGTQERLWPVAWDGVTDGGAVVYTGRYFAELTATNELRSVSLGACFSVRRTSVFEVAK